MYCEQKKHNRGVNAEKEAAKRREAAFSLRNKKKEELLREKRRRDQGDEVKATVVAEEDLSTQATRLPQLFQQMCTGTAHEQMQATLIVRKLLCMSRDPPLDEVIQVGCVPKLIEFLHRTEEPMLQFEAAWALTNIVSGTSAHTSAVVEAGGVMPLLQLLYSTDEDVREQAVWALGNIAGDSAHYRNMVLDMGAVEPLLNIIRSGPKLTTLRNVAWALSNLCRNKPQPDLQKIQPILAVIPQLIQHHDEEVQAEALWSVSYVSDSDKRVDAVLAIDGLLKRCCELLTGQQQTVLMPALRILGNIVTGNDRQTQQVLDAGALPLIHRLMTSTSSRIRKECCWNISNIAAGTVNQIQELITANIIPTLVSSLQPNVEWEVRKEAMWAVSNITATGKPEQVNHLVNCGVLDPLCNFLVVPDAKMLGQALDCLSNILRIGEEIAAMSGSENVYKTYLIENGVEKIEELQEHPILDVHSKAQDILQTFFECEEVEHGGDEDNHWGVQEVQPQFNF